jgi:hypothetical protein
MLLLYYVKAMEMTKLFITIDFKLNGLLKESPRTLCDHVTLSREVIKQ